MDQTAATTPVTSQTAVIKIRGTNMRFDGFGLSMATENTYNRPIESNSRKSMVAKVHKLNPIKNLAKPNRSHALSHFHKPDGSQDEIDQQSHRH